MIKRDSKIDIFKFIGLFLIVLAHSRGLIQEIDYFRNIEVVLFVLISGILYSRGCQIKKKEDYYVYLRKRIQKLVFPTWGFLSCLFIILLIMSAILRVKFPYSKRDIIESYLMINGIGYVWIMLVYIWIAIFLPILIYILEKNKKLYNYILLITMYCFYEFIRYELVNNNSIISYYIKNTIPYCIIYPLIAMIGYYIDVLSNKKILIISSCLLLFHVIFIFIFNERYGFFPNLGKYKYPPTFIYLSYGIGGALFLILLIRKFLNFSVSCQIFSFIGKNVQWIYLNHIYFIFIWNQFINKEYWLLMTLFCFWGSVIITFFQVKFVKIITTNKYSKWSRIVKTIFG